MRCMWCGQKIKERKETLWDKKLSFLRNFLEERGISGTECYWNNTPTQRAINDARKVAWQSVGVIPNTASVLGRFNIEPKHIFEMDEQQIKMLPSVGDISKKALLEITEQSQQIWEQTYSKWYGWLEKESIQIYESRHN